MSTTDIELKDGDGITQEYYGVESITLNGVDGTNKTFVYNNNATGTIEQTEIISLNTNKSTTATQINIVLNDNTFIFYKLDEHMPTKSELLGAEWQVSGLSGAPLVKKQLIENEIIMDTSDILAFQFSIDPQYAYAICYTIGTITVEFLGNTITIEIPETGIYQAWSSELGNLPTTIVGQCIYQNTEIVNFVQSNWNQNDYTQADYIKNRICNSQNNDIIFYQNEQAAFKGMADIHNINLQHNFTSNQIDKDLVGLWQSDWTTAIVSWDGIEFICQPRNFLGIKCIGNVEEIEDGEPFILGYGMIPYDSIPQATFLCNTLEESANFILSISTSDFTTSTDSIYQTAFLDNISLDINTDYYIELNDTPYELQTSIYSYNGEEIIGMGNPNIIGLTTEDANTELTFFIYSNSTGELRIATPLTYTDITCGIRTNPTVYHNISITLKNEKITPINPKFIRNVDYETQITNKPFGIQTKELVPISEITILEDDGTESYSVGIEKVNYNDFENGLTYTVQVGNIAQTGACKYVVTEGKAAALIQTNDIYVIASEEIGGGILLFPRSIINSDTSMVGQKIYIKVSTQITSIQKINPMFLPNGMDIYDEGVKFATLDTNNLPQDNILGVIYKLTDDILTVEHLSKSTITGTYVTTDGNNTLANCTCTITGIMPIYNTATIKGYQIMGIDSTTGFECYAMILIAHTTGVVFIEGAGSIDIPSTGTYAFFEGDNGENFHIATMTYHYKQQLKNTLLQCLEAQANETIVETNFTCTTFNGSKYITNLTDMPALYNGEQYIVTVDENQEVYTALSYGNIVVLGAYNGNTIYIANYSSTYDIMMPDNKQHTLKIEKLGNYTLKETYLPNSLYDNIQTYIRNYIDEVLGSQTTT